VYPILKADQPMIDLKSLPAWIKRTEGKEYDSYKLMQGMSRFFNMLLIDGTPWIEVMNDENKLSLTIELKNSGILDDVLDLPIIDTSHSWTLKTMNGMKAWCDYLLATMTDDRDDYIRVQRQLEKLKTEYFHNVKKDAQKQKTKATTSKRIADGRLIDKFEEAERIKQCVVTALKDFRILVKDAVTSGTADKMTTHKCNIIVAGVIYFSTFAGRPGEWSAILCIRI
jgi:hypothetical protein